MVQDCFELTAFGCEIRVEASCPQTYETLERYVFPSLRRAAIPSRRPPHLLINMSQLADQIQLRANHVLVASADVPDKLVPDLIRVLDDTVIPRLSGLRAIHAGAVLWNGRGLLLPGASHSGKSSLVAELLKCGATYLSDEYALIDSEGRVHPYPRPLLLRNGSPQQSPALPSEWNVATATGPAPIGWILALQYHPSCTFRVLPVSQGEMLLTLLRNTPHSIADAPNLVEIFQHAVSGAVCYRGHRPDAPRAVEEILKLIGDCA